jgi:uridine kinase
MGKLLRAMLEDVLLIQDHHRQAAAEIVQHIVPQITPKYLIAISGESGSGKSELSHMVARELIRHGHMTKTLHTDNFYKTLPLERGSWRQREGIEKVVGPGEYDWNLLHRVMDDFRHDRTSEMPCIDLITQKVDTLVTDFSNIDVLVLDGLYAVRASDINIAIMIELTYHETKKAQSSRGKEHSDPVRFQVLEAEHKAVQALRPLVHIFINKEYKVVYL